MALVEKLLGRLDDGGHDSRVADDVAGRAHGAVADPAGDLSDLERELRSSCKRVSALIHRCRARVGRLTSPGDPVTLDAEGPQHRAEREVERFENGALLDV